MNDDVFITDASVLDDVTSLLRLRADRMPDATAYEFVDRFGKTAERLTYGELDRRACGIASLLAASTRLHDRVLLAFPPGLDFVAALFGCFYAQRLAVPVALPRSRRSADAARLAAIAQDCGFARVLGNAPARARLEEFEELQPAFRERWLSIEDAPQYGASPQRPKHDAIALLQYTSGSTGMPKGVMVRHSGLMHNAWRVLKQIRPDQSSRSLCWLPHFHDLGLVGAIIQPIHGGFPSSLMDALNFLKRPLAWLRAIGEGRYSVSAAPNFAYAMCVERFDPAALNGVDLSSWRWAINGAEQINARTSARFIELLAPWGLREDVMTPGYGLAEATLTTTFVYDRRPFLARAIDRDGFERQRRAIPAESQEAARMVVACGRRASDQTLVIVDPASGHPLGDNEVGEIWVADASVAAGYWGRPEETAATFEAKSPAYPGISFLRTGDLGFLDGGELYVAGRLKDIIIIDGRNLDPADIESGIAQAVGVLPSRGVVAFTIDEDVVSPELVVVIEVGAGESADIAQKVRNAVSERFHLRVDRIVPVAPGAIPRTTSGKIRRRDTRVAILTGTLSEKAAPAPALVQ